MSGGEKRFELSEADQGRRTLLTGVTALLGAIGGAAWLTPFLKSWKPSAKARAAGAPITVDLAKLKTGELFKTEWRGKPIYILKRSQEIIATLKGDKAHLRDPESVEDQQPEYAQNDLRSLKPELMVLEGVCTHLGCAPKTRMDDGGDGEFDGFFCPCHGSKFDFAGRVYKGVPAPTNMVVPPYGYKNDGTLVVGVDQEEIG